MRLSLFLISESTAASMRQGEKMAKNDMLFVYNPKAGKTMIRNNLLDVIDVFVKAGYEVTVRPTQRPGEAIEIVKNKKIKYDILACSGGDGTLNEVVQGMTQCEEKIPIGYIPAGSTNDFANSLEIPRNMVQAAEIVAGGRNYAFDIGMLNDAPFVYVAAFGLFTEVSYETNQEMKNMFGHTAYIWEAIKKLTNVRSYHMKVTYDDKFIEDDFLVGMVSNSVSVGGVKNITGENVKLDDGLFEVTLIKSPQNPIELNLVLAALMDRSVATDKVYYFKTGCVRFESEEGVSWTIDGEYGGTHQSVVVENKPRTLQIRVP